MYGHFGILCIKEFSRHKTSQCSTIIIKKIIKLNTIKGLIETQDLFRLISFLLLFLRGKSATALSVQEVVGCLSFVRCGINALSMLGLHMVWSM